MARHSSLIPGDNSFSLIGKRLAHGDFLFELATHVGKRGRDDGPITIKKPTWMVERYIELARLFDAPQMVELGLWDGGSTAFLAGLGNGMISELRVRQGFADIYRGSAEIDADLFKVRDCIGRLGRQLLPAANSH